MPGRLGIVVVSAAIIGAVAIAAPAVAQTPSPPTPVPSKDPAVVDVSLGSGDGRGGHGTASRNGGVVDAAVEETSSGGSTPGSSGAPKCTWTLIDGAPVQPLNMVPEYPYTDPHGVVHHLYVKSCTDGSLNYVDVPERDPKTLLPDLERELKEKVIHKPVANYIVDPKHNWTYVRVPFDFRVTPDSWKPVSVTATVEPFSVTVEAHPAHLTFDPGDPMWYANPPVTCGGNAPLAPYVPETPGECAYIYKDSSSISPFDHYHFQTTLSTEWAITWHASNGAGGSLGSYTATSTTPLAVAEVQALTICTGPRPQQGGCGP